MPPRWRAPQRDNPDLDTAYLFLPTGAHTASAFPGFSYVLLAGGSSGNLQVTLDCRGTGTAGRSSAPRPFSCAGSDGPIVESIDGTFDLAATPTALTFTMKRSGFAASYTLPTAAKVADTDPNAADLATFAAQLGMAPWDVTPLPADNPDGDLAYVLFPTGAQNLSVFQAFYYHLFEGGAAGNLQIMLTCLPK